MKFSSASEQSTASGVKILAYGPAGIGKTMLAATLPNNPILISAEAGALSLKKKNLERIWGVNHPDVTYDMKMIIIETMDDLATAYKFLNSEQGKQFGSVALDSLSEIAESILRNEKKLVKDPRQAYGAIIDKVEQMLVAYRDLPGRHVYFSAKMESVKDEVTGYTKFWPAMPGAKLGQRLPYYFDEVLRVGVMKDKDGEDRRFVQTQPDMQYEAKDRSGALAPIELPNLTQIIKKIQGA